MNKSIYLTILFFLGILNISNGQLNLDLTIGVTTPRKNYPNGIKQRYTIGYDSKIKLAYLLKEKFNVGLQSGLYYFSYSSQQYRASTFIIPINLSAEYLITKTKLIPYLGFGVGGYQSIFHNKYDDLDMESIYRYFDFGLTPLIGMRYKISDRCLINARGEFLYLFNSGIYNYYLYNLDLGIIYKFK